MASPAPDYQTQFDPQTGEAIAVAPGLVRITAPNASPYTFTGTNSFLVGHETLAVIDPGPDDESHLAALRRGINGRSVSAVILSHTHRDHSAAAGRIAQELGAPLWFGGRHRLSRPLHRFERNRLRGSCDWDLVPDRVLVDGEDITAGDVAVQVHATPGHCANHLAFGLGELLLSGDHVMGWSSTLVGVPDGSMADYLKSLETVIGLTYRAYVPAHGGEIADGAGYARALLAHRRQRNEQVVAAVSAGARRIGQIVRAIYPQQSLAVRRAAAMTVLAHVEYLEALGRVRVKRGVLGVRVYSGK